MNEILRSQSHKNQQMSQQVSRLTHSLELKNKEIFYLSSQIVSLKQQFAKERQKYQNNAVNSRKQIKELRFKLLKFGNQEADRLENTIIENRKGFESKVQLNKEHYEILIQKQREKFNKQLDICKDKYEGLLGIAERQVKSMEGIVEEKNKQNEQLRRKAEEERRKNVEEKNELNEQIRVYKDSLEEIKIQFNRFTNDTSSKQRQAIIQFNIIKENEKNNLIKITKLQSLVENLKKTNKHEIQNMEITIQKYKVQAQRYKLQINNKDNQITKLLSDQRNNQLSPSKNITIKHVKQCDHQTYIKQLQTNVRYKQKQNKFLRKKLQDWSDEIGFDKKPEQRLIEIKNCSQNACDVYNKFRRELKGEMSKRK